MGAGVLVMSINPNHIPWMTILGLVGLGVGYLIGGGSGNPQAMTAGLYGLVGGSLLGIIVRVVARYLRVKKQDEKQDNGTSE